MKYIYIHTRLYFLFITLLTMYPLFLVAETSVQTPETQIDFTPQGFYAYKLENGLELYVQEDFTTPTVRIEYVTKGGTQRQTSETTGFYQLYTRLFWQNSVPGVAAYNSVGAGNFSAQGGSSQSRYSFTVSSSSFENAISLFADGLKKPSFSDAVIKNEFDTLKQEVSAWEGSVPGFINSAVDARVFSVAPWTKDSGVYPALFTSHPLETVRQKLSHVGKTWYVPDQSAIFISGPLPTTTILNAVKTEFTSWQSGYTIGRKSDASMAQSASALIQNIVPVDQIGKKTEMVQKFFVLVSKDFSPDFIQAVLQYTAPGLGANNEYSATAWAAAEIMQSKLISAGMNNSDTAFVADAADSRIIIQTLFDVQSLGENTNTSLLVPSFANIVKSTARSFSENDLDNAKQRSLLFRNDAYMGSTAFMNAIVTNWAYGGIEYFFAWPKAVQDLQLASVQNIFSDPWIFVLMHPDIYIKNSDRFAEVGYTEITPKTGAWYSHNLATIDEQSINNAESIPPESIEGLPQNSSIANYATYTKSLMDQFTLTSGIPITTQKIPATQWTSVLVSIQGGEILHGALKRGTESIAVKNLALSIETKLARLYRNGHLTDLPTIQSETQLYSSSLSLIALSQDIPLVLQTIADSFKSLNILLSRADELFLSEAYNWRITSGSLEYQLYAAAMETLYDGSAAEGFFNANTELLLDADYNDIRIASNALYAPSRLNIVLSGNIKSDLASELEKHFGSKTFAGTKKTVAVQLIPNVEPIFASIEQIVQLRHTFLTDVPSELAGARPQSLIPTTDFSDPAQFYFAPPALNTADEAIFTAILYEIVDRLTAEFSSMNEPPAETVAIVPGTSTHPILSLRFSKVKSRERLKSTVDKVFNKLLSDLSDLAQTQGDSLSNPNASEQTINLITSIKNRYTRIMSRGIETLEERSHFIQEGINLDENPALYLERYIIVENSTAQDFYDIFTHFIDTVIPFWVFSADTDKY